MHYADDNRNRTGHDQPRRSPVNQQRRGNTPVIAQYALDEQAISWRRIEPCLTQLWMVVRVPSTDQITVTRVRAWAWSESITDRDGYSEVAFGPLGLVESQWVGSAWGDEGIIAPHTAVYDSYDEAVTAIAAANGR